MQEILEKYLPDRSVLPVFELIKTNDIHLKIVNERVTKHGDYRRYNNGQHQITVNASLNKYRFLMTLIHEIAHLIAFEEYGRKIKPHGIEWKNTFRQLMLPFINPSVFPNKVLPLIAKHFKNPKASSDTDAALSVALQEFDLENEQTYIFQIPAGSTFRISNGKVFKKGNKRIKRYECLEISTGKVYLFQPNASIELL